MDLPRGLDLPGLLRKKSFFLLGPRGTGKSRLVRAQLGADAKVIDLLKTDLYLRLSGNPSELETMIGPKRDQAIVVIDEVQKVPEILDEVHRLIETRGIRFLLTGSSARKLRRGHANLLAGRAWIANLFPLTSNEIPNLDLDRYLLWGGLPAVYLSSDPAEELIAYTGTYLREEIQAEGLVRRLPAFSRFLPVAALSSGSLMNYAQVASDCEVPASTVKEFFQILEDTLIGFRLEPWTASRKRKAIATAKFYLFDPGVTHALLETRALDRHSDLYGRSFEQFIALELRAYLSYRRSRDGLRFWRSKHGQEVDFVVGDHTAIEVKATRRASRRDASGLRALAEERKFRSFYLVTQDPVSASDRALQRLHWKRFLELLWSDEIFAPR